MTTKRVVFDADTVRFIATSHSELVRYFKDLCNPNSSRADSWDNRAWNEVDSVRLFIYDSSRDVSLEMGGDLLIQNTETEEILIDDWWKHQH